MNVHLFPVICPDICIYLCILLFTCLYTPHTCIHLSRFEDYLMDNFYREGNFDLQAQDILLEFGLDAPVGTGMSG